MSVQSARRHVSEMKAAFSQALGESVDILDKAVVALRTVDNGHLDPDWLANWCRLTTTAINSLQDMAMVWRAAEALMAEIERDA